MYRLWQWVWDRHGAQFTVWAILALGVVLLFPVNLTFAAVVLGIKRPNNWARAVPLAIAAAAACTIALAAVLTPIAHRCLRPVDRWAAGPGGDRHAALVGTYMYSRQAVPVSTAAGIPVFAALFALSAVIGGASTAHVIQFGAVGAVTGFAANLTAAHGIVEAAMRPARLALTRDSDIGDTMPRARPSFAVWSNTAALTAAFTFSLLGAMLGAAAGNTRPAPLVYVAIAAAVTIWIAAPITVGAAFAPSLTALRDLDDAADRVAAGDYTHRLPVVQDDDLGTLAGSFNRMQTGLLERKHLHSAFGTYVDPALAARLLEQGDNIFTGERRTVTIMFLDIRNFTPYTETHTAETVVGRLNELFEIVVPTVVTTGGHVNKFLGDGALAVFGAPTNLDNHADAALAAARHIHQQVTHHFGNDLHIGIGINTGPVIAGTIGGGGKLEFTLIGDSVNVAARVEQLTKTTGDSILLTQACRSALHDPSPNLLDRGTHRIKGKIEPVHVYGGG